MAGEEKLENLLARMSPTLRPGEFVFCFLGHAKYGDHPELEPIGSFMESEGLTMVVPKNKADEHGVEYESVFKCITLMVHSSLDAIGLTAAFSARLTRHGISANVIAGYFHDHIFVQRELAQKAIIAINELAEESKESGGNVI